MTERILWVATFLAVLVVPVGASAQTGMPEAVVRIETDDSVIEIDVEVASTADDRATGLMDRDFLAESAGMLFLFERPRSAGSGFYMYRTRIPLDIAFADSAGRIVEILTMPPCAATQRSVCPQYPPGVSYQVALEVNAGFFAARGVEVGDHLHLSAVRTPGSR